MSDFTPLIPVSLQIRKIIFEKFNDTDTKFTNDQIFEILKSYDDIDPSWIIDDTESLFNDLCESYAKYSSKFYYYFFKII